MGFATMAGTSGLGSSIGQTAVEADGWRQNHSGSTFTQFLTGTTHPGDPTREGAFTECCRQGRTPDPFIDLPHGQTPLGSWLGLTNMTGKEHSWGFLCKGT